MTDDHSVHRVDDLDCQIVSYDWAFARERAADIAANWEALRAQKPEVFNGPVYLTCGWSIERTGQKTTLHSRHFETDYRSFMAWRDFGFPGPDVCNSFAAAALKGADGGFLLGEMGAHTANAGMIYFPCGTPDKNDAVDGRLDMYGSVFRELAEETGLVTPVVKAGTRWTVISSGPYLALLLDVTSGHTVRELARLASTFLAADENPELAGVHCVQTPADVRPDVMPVYVQNFFAARFSDAQQQ